VAIIQNECWFFLTKANLRVRRVPKRIFTLFIITHSSVLTVLLQVDRYMVADFLVESYTSETSAESYSPTLWGYSCALFCTYKMEWDNQFGLTSETVYCAI